MPYRVCRRHYVSPYRTFKQAINFDSVVSICLEINSISIVCFLGNVCVFVFKFHAVSIFQKWERQPSERHTKDKEMIAESGLKMLY